MTLSGTRQRAYQERRRNVTGMRVSGWLLVILALSVVAAPFLLNASFPVRMLGVFVAANIVHKAGWSLWAAHTGRIAGTKVLAMFAALFGVAYAITPWFMGDRGAILYVAGALGALVVIVSTFDAFVSPDEDRRVAFEPREPADVSEFEVSAHGDEHRGDQAP